MNPDGCRKLAQSAWNDWKSKIESDQLPASMGKTSSALKELSLSDVLAACPKQGAAVGQPVVIGSAMASSYAPKSAKEVFARKCTMCHGNTLPFDDPKQLASKDSMYKPGAKVRQEILRRINSPDDNVRMPKGGQLNPTEIQLLEAFFAAEVECLVRIEKHMSRFFPSKGFAAAGVGDFLREAVGREILGNLDDVRTMSHAGLNRNRCAKRPLFTRLPATNGRGP
jgi:mono/diheme cytochrome c family protein